MKREERPPPRKACFARLLSLYSLLRQFALLVALASLFVGLHIGRCPLGSVAVLSPREDGGHIVRLYSFKEYTPARTMTNAGVAHAECKYWLFTCGADSIWPLVVCTFGDFQSNNRALAAKNTKLCVNV